MAETRNFIRPLFAILCIGVTVVGFYNVYGDNGEARSLAESTACGKPGCSPRLLENARNPIGQTFAFQLGETGRSNVSCHRKFYLIGDWTCEREGGPATPMPSSSKN
jgi:hypothetical protein